jgi:hypothetical protein
MGWWNRPARLLFVPLTGFAGPASGSTEFNPGRFFEPVPRACKHADFLD